MKVLVHVGDPRVPPIELDAEQTSDGDARIVITADHIRQAYRRAKQQTPELAGDVVAAVIRGMMRGSSQP